MVSLPVIKEDFHGTLGTTVGVYLLPAERQNGKSASVSRKSGLYLIPTTANCMERWRPRREEEDSQTDPGFNAGDMSVVKETKVLINAVHSLGDVFVETGYCGNGNRIAHLLIRHGGVIKAEHALQTREWLAGSRSQNEFIEHTLH